MFVATNNQKLNEIEIDIDERSATTVVLVSGGYPESYEKGKMISGIETVNDSIVFHAGAKNADDKIITSGGRVLAITSFGENFKQALKKSYQSIEKIQFDKMYCRKDLGFDL